MTGAETTALLLFGLFCACSIWGWVMFVRTVKAYRQLKKDDREGAEWTPEEEPVEQDHDEN